MPPAKSNKTKSGETILKIKDIYENDGMDGLIRQNLNKNHKSLGEYIQKYLMDGGSRTKNVNGCTGKDKPCLWCCKQLDIMDERGLWVKKTFANECNFEELIEYHIQPIVDKYGVSGHTWMLRNYSAIIRRIKALNKTWQQDIEIRHYNIQPKDKIVVKNGDKIITCCDSQAEAYFDMVVLQISGLMIIDRNIPYPDDFMKKNNRTKSTCDRRLSYEGKEYPIEIWGTNDNDNDNVGSCETVINKVDYIKKRKEKEDYWSQKDTNFIGIEFRTCNSRNNILKILRDKISPGLQFEENSTIKICRINEDTIKQNTLDEAALLQEDGHLPSSSKIPCSMWHKIQKYWPTPHMENFRKALGEDMESFKKLHHKHLSESKKKSGVATGKNNPMFGKKGKDNPNYGKKQPRCDYISTYCPKLKLYLESLNEGGYVTQSNFITYAKSNDIKSHTPWSNPADNNPWKESKFKGYYEDTIEYCKKRNIIIPNNLKITKGSCGGIRPNRYQNKKWTTVDVFKAHANMLKSGISPSSKNWKDYISQNNLVLPKTPWTKGKSVSDHPNSNATIYGVNYKEFLEKTHQFSKLE